MVGLTEMLIFSIIVSFISIPASAAIHIFQTEPTVIKNTLSRWITKAAILTVGVGILVVKSYVDLHSIDGRIVATSASPSKKMTLQVRKSCCLICSNIKITASINKGSHKGYSETCTISANHSEPVASSQFRWNTDETIISWESPDNSRGEIDLQKDCGYPTTPNSLDHSDPRKFVFVSPSGNKILFRKRSCLVRPCKETFALRVKQSEDTGWNSYYCNLQIPNGTQAHGGSMRTEDIPDNVAIAPVVRWNKNETVIYSEFQRSPFSFDLQEVCDLKQK